MNVINENSCPRHGRPGSTDRNNKPVDLGPRIRCDCLETLLAALVPLKMGKWVRAAGHPIDVRNFGITDMGTYGEAVEARANEALHEAILAAYHLGLRGGVDPFRVRTCAACANTFYTEYDLTVCGTCSVKNET